MGAVLGVTVVVLAALCACVLLVAVALMRWQVKQPPSVQNERPTALRRD